LSEQGFHADSALSKAELSHYFGHFKQKVFTRLRRASYEPWRSAGFKAFRTALWASQVTFLWWAKKGNPKKAHPALVPYAHSLCFGCARLLRGSLTAHPCAGSSRAHIVWALLRTFPTQSHHERGGPIWWPSWPQPRATCFDLFWSRIEKFSDQSSFSAQTPWFVPSNAVGHGSKAPLSEARDGRVGAGPWTVRREGHIARCASDARNPGGLLFAYFLLSTQEKVTRTPKACESSVLKMSDAVRKLCF